MLLVRSSAISLNKSVCFFKFNRPIYFFSFFIKIEYFSWTSDIWTDCTLDPYIAITMHWLDESFCPQHACLDMESFSDSHTSEAISSYFTKAAETYMHSKSAVVALIADGAANMQGGAVDFTGDAFDVQHCFAHRLNLVVRNALDEHSKTITEIRDYILAMRASSLFRKAVLDQQKGDKKRPKQLKIDCKTRWDSTYDMLDRFLELFDVALSPLDRMSPIQGLPVLPRSQYTNALVITSALKPIRDISKAAQSLKFPTLAFVPIWITTVLDKLKTITATFREKQLTKENDKLTRFIASLEKGIKNRFASVWDGTSLENCAAALTLQFGKRSWLTDVEEKKTWTKLEQQIKLITQNTTNQSNELQAENSLARFGLQLDSTLDDTDLTNENVATLKKWCAL